MTSDDARAFAAPTQREARTAEPPPLALATACPRCGAAVPSPGSDFCEACSAHLYPGHCVFCLDPFTTGIGNTNLPPSRRYGVELEGRLNPLPSWSLGANYSYTVAKFRSGVLPGGAFTRSNVNIGGKNVPLVPQHKLNADVQWIPAKNSTLTLSASYVSKQILDNDEPNDLGVTIPGYTVVDLKFTQKFGAWQAALAVNNLFDKEYFNYAVRSQFTQDRYAVYPLPGRTATASLSYHF